MAGEDELAYLKSLVSQLNEKIKALEEKAKKAVSPTQRKSRGFKTTP